MAGRLGPHMSTTAMRRQSCDRCHGQKLRCTRSGFNSTSPCSRCRRQGAQCTYSFSLPKGRPSRYRSVGAAGPSISTPGSGSGSPNDSSTEWGQGPFGGPYDALTLTAGSTSTGADDSGAAPPPSNASGSTDANSPISASAARNWSWSDGMSWGAADGGEGHAGVYPFIDSHIHIDTGVSSTPEDSLLSWETPTGFNSESDGHLFNDNSGSPPSSLGRNLVAPVPEEIAPADIIAQLSQLSTRLHPLLSSSCLLAETEGMPPPKGGLMLNDAEFEPLAEWLAHVSPDRPRSETQGLSPAGAAGLGGVIHDAFTASHRLLEILHCLRVNRDPIRACFTPSSQSASGEYGGVPTKGARGSINSHFSGRVVHHLVMACHGLLLNVYVVVLIALQLDADLLLSANEPGPLTSLASHAGHLDRPLADIRIVSVLHLCVYLVERQGNAVKHYLSPLNSPAVPRSTSRHVGDALGLVPDEPGPGPSSRPSAPMHLGQEITSQLEMDVHQRLSRLRLTLHI